MGLINVTQQAYYSQSQSFTATGSSNTVTITTVYFPTLPAVGKIDIFINGNQISTGNYSYNASNGVITFTGNANNTNVIALVNGQYRPIAGFIIEVKEIDKSEKIQEIELGPSLSMPMPQDYIHYVRLSYIDDAGIENIIYPARYTSRPSESILQDDDYKYLFDSTGALLTGTPVTNDRFKEFDISKLTGNDIGGNTSYDQDDSLDRIHVYGGRYGLDPETAQNNGVFIIDELNGKISFSSDLANRIITLKYLNYAIASTKANYPEYIINRFRKERRAAIRNAKLRLSSLKLEELTQVMRGKSKVIK